MNKAIYENYAPQSTIVFLVSLVLISISNVQLVSAACSCSIGSNGISIIGVIFQARSCPNDSGTFTYDGYLVSCNGSSIYHWNYSLEDLSGTPEKVIGYKYPSTHGDVILRNPEGTNLIFIEDGPSSAPRFNGTIEGVSISDKSPGTVYQASPPERLDKYCIPLYSQNMNDTDGDGYPDCLDCDPLDSNLNYHCPLAKTAKNLGQCLQ